MLLKFKKRRLGAWILVFARTTEYERHWMSLVCLYLYYHRQDHRPPAGFIEEELADLVADERFQIIRIGLVVVRQSREQRADPFSYLFEYFLILFEIDETARNNVGIFKKFSLVVVERHDDDEHAFLRQRPPVAENAFFHVAHPRRPP